MVLFVYCRVLTFLTVVLMYVQGITCVMDSCVEDLKPVFFQGSGYFLRLLAVE